METLKGKAPSWRARCWTRLLDPDKPPRRWWYPPSSRRDDVLRMSEEARQAHQKVVEQAHEKFSETIRLAMLSLLGFTLFCLLITLSTPDSALLVADPTIKMPFADVQVSFQSFLILAPFLLIVVALYLHIFYGYWLDLEIDYQHLMLRREAREPSIERLPTLFSLDHPVPRLLTAFIFYWLVPIVLLVITWKAAARVEWGVPLALLTCLVTGTLVFLRIRRRPAAQRWWNRPRWAVLGLIVGCGSDNGRVRGSATTTTTETSTERERIRRRLYLGHDHAGYPEARIEARHGDGSTTKNHEGNGVLPSMAPTPVEHFPGGPQGKVVDSGEPPRRRCKPR
jgi:hypothetical protein